MWPHPGDPAEERRIQMEFYDRLGPLARAAVRDSPKDFDVELLVSKFDRQMIFRGRMIRTDFNAPETDAKVAQFVHDTVRGRFALSFLAPADEKPASFALVARRRRMREHSLHGPSSSDSTQAG